MVLFAYLQLIMSPAFQSSGDPAQAWGTTLFAACLSGLTQLACVPFTEQIRKVVPSAALFSALAGTAITFLTLNFTFQIFARPFTSLVPLAVVFMSFSAEIKFPLGLPGGFMALLCGVALGQLNSVFEFEPDTTGSTADPVALSPPYLAIFEVVQGAQQFGQVLPTVLPLALLTVVNNMAALESAAAAGDEYNLQMSLIIDAFATIGGAFLGCPFPTSIFIGHPAYKKMGAKLGYLGFNMLAVGAICFSAATSLFLLYIPLESVVTVLLWIGVVITAQAFTSIPRGAAGSVAIGMIPACAAWSLELIRTIFSALPGRTLQEVMVAAPQLYLDGLISIAAGYLLVSLVLSALYYHIEERRFAAAAGWAVAASVFSATGMMHSFEVHGNTVSSMVGWFPSQRSSVFCFVYLLVAAVLAIARLCSGLQEDISLPPLPVCGGGGTDSTPPPPWTPGSWDSLDPSHVTPEYIQRDLTNPLLTEHQTLVMQ